MAKAASHTKQSVRDFAVIDNGSWRGIIAPKSVLSPKRLAMLIDDLEDTDPKFLAAVHKEYEQAKAKGSFVTSSEIEQELTVE